MNHNTQLLIISCIIKFFVPNLIQLNNLIIQLNITQYAYKFKDKYYFC